MVVLNLFIRIIGFTYEVLLSKLLGAEAMGFFQIALSTLMVFLIITSSGTPTAIIKLVAEHNSKNNKSNIESIYKTSLLLNLCISMVLGVILLISAEFIAIRVFKNRDMLYGVYLLFPAIIIISISIVLKSFYYGMKNIITPGIAEIIEQSIRFIVVMGILYYAYPIKPIYGAMIAILGISIGEMFNLSWSLIAKNRLYKNKSHSSTKEGTGISFIIKILTISLPLTISGFFSVLLRFSNTIIIPSKLMEAGFTSSESIATFGRIMGMTMPLVHLPFIVTSALVINLIPSLTEQIILKKYKEIRNDIVLSIKATLLISIPLTAIFIFLSNALALFLYSDPLVADFIKIMGFSTIFFALQHNFLGIFHGLDKHMPATINRLIGMIVQVLLLYFLVGDPRFGISGIFISFYCSIFIIMVMDIFTLKKLVKLNLNYLDILGKPILASIFMILFIYLTNYDIENLQNANALVFASSLLVGIFSYIFILVLTKAIPKNFFGRMFKTK